MSNTSKVLIALIAVLALFTFAPAAFAQSPESIATAKPVSQSLVKVVALKYATAHELETVIRQLKSPNRGRTDFTIASDNRTNSLLIRGSEKEMARIEGMIAALDRNTVAPKRLTPQAPQIEVISIEHRRAATLGPVVMAVFADDAGRRPRVARALPPVRVVIDDELNAVIVKATKSEMDQVRSLIARLDVPIKNK